MRKLLGTAELSTLQEISALHVELKQKSIGLLLYYIMNFGVGRI